jgi:hypothetical protein
MHYADLTLMLKSPLKSVFQFKVQGALFTIATDLVIQRLGLFQADRSRLASGEWAVATAVPAAIFRDFVAMIEGKPIAITEANLAALTKMSEEFEFAELYGDFRRFSDRCARQTCGPPSLSVAPLILRLSQMEERHLALERTLSHEKLLGSYFFRGWIKLKVK